jgi:glyoxylate/hydroxypyruvate reductase
MCGPSIGHPDTTIGFLGFGRISQETVKRLLAFTNKQHPPTILYNSSRARSNQAEIDADLTKKFGVTVKRVEKDELAEKSDVVIVLCVQNDSTINLVNKDFLKKMKKSAVLVNGARVSCSLTIVPARRGWALTRTGSHRQLGRSGVGAERRGDLRSRFGRHHWRTESRARPPIGQAQAMCCDPAHGLGRL